MALIINLWSFSPILIALSLLMVSAVPLYIAGFYAFFPLVDIMVIYYWVSNRPSSMPIWFIFILGILRDALEGISMGVNVFIYLLTAFTVMASKSIYKRESFWLVWQGFAITALISISIKWLLVSFEMGIPLTAGSAIMQLTFSIAVYPLFYWFFNIMQSTMPKYLQDE